MPDRYGEKDDDDDPPDEVIVDQSIVDFESRRLDRESIQAKARELNQRKRLAETRATHASLGSEQARMVSQQRRQVSDHANDQRRVLRIASCQLCDDDGYLLQSAVICDHVDRRNTHSRGMAAVRQAMGWDAPPPPTPLPVVPATEARVTASAPTAAPAPIHTQEAPATPESVSGALRCGRCGREGEAKSQIDVHSMRCHDCLWGR